MKLPILPILPFPYFTLIGTPFPTPPPTQIRLLYTPRFRLGESPAVERGGREDVSWWGWAGHLASDDLHVE